MRSYSTRHHSRLSIRRLPLHLEMLEDRLPVSEQVGPYLTLSALVIGDPAAPLADVGPQAQASGDDRTLPSVTLEPWRPPHGPGRVRSLPALPRSP